MKHRKFGGSTAARTIACPGWHNESQGIPRGTSIFAEIGTALHDCMERIVLEDLDPGYFLDVTVNGIVITQDMVTNKLWPALKAFNELCERYSVSEFEPEVECSYAADIGGYADIVLRGASNTVIVADWKFGDGHQVFPEELPQAKFYGMAARENSNAADLFKGTTCFVAAIIQPNERGLDDLRVWETDIAVLDLFEKQYCQAVAEARSKHPPLKAGDWCSFCPAAPVCPTKTGQALAALRMDPEDLESLSQALDLVSELKPWIRDVEKVAFEQLNAGAPVVGWKLVQKRATAKWDDEDAVTKLLRRRLGGLDRITVRKLKTPTQMKKLVKEREAGNGVDELIENHIIKTSSGPTMAREDDKRPAILSGDALSAALKALS
jgi:hypothetical protein